MANIKGYLDDLRSEEWWVRERAMKNLLEYPEEIYIEFLERGLKNHNDAILRNASMELYSRLGKRALKSLLRLSSDEDSEIRIFATILLGDIRVGEAVVPLIERLKDPDINVRVASAEALGKIGDPSAIPALKEAIGDEPWVAMAAIRSLGEIGGDEALSILYKTLEIKEYRGITFEAIEMAGDERAMVHLTRFVDRDDLRELALKAIVSIAERKGLRIEPEYFVGLLPVLLELQESPHREIKRASLIALSWLRDVRAIPYLLRALGQEDLQEYAISGILSIGRKAIPEIVAALRDKERPYRNILVRIMLLFGEELSLLQFHNDDDPEVRAEVALALGNIDSDESITILSRLTEDSEEEVRLAAMRSLNRIRKMSHGEHKIK